MSKTKTSHSENPLLELPRLIERMHRRYLDVLRRLLEEATITDISPVQLMMMYNIGHDEIAVRDLIERGYYLGSNASYNLKQLVEQGYVLRSQAARDKRSARLKLSPKGQDTFKNIRKKENELHATFEGTETAENIFKFLRKLERHWTDTLRFTDDFDGDF